MPGVTPRAIDAALWAATAACVAIAAWVLVQVGVTVADDPALRAQQVAIHLGLILLVGVPVVVLMAHGTPRARMDAAGGRRSAEFLATMSHEIRTPLNAVLGYSELLSRTRLDKSQQEYLWGVRTSGSHLLSIVNDVLDYSKIQAGRIELEEVAFDVVSLLDGATMAVSVQAKEKGVALFYQVDPAMPRTLFGDETRLRQVLLNLLSNAVKFTAQGSIEVHARSVAQGEGRYLVSFLVRDTGIGIAPEARGRLFTPFSQVDASTTRLHGGTGLGLAISRRLCELMGGDLSVESELGKGSTFTASAVVMAAPAASAASADDTALLRGLRVLVVDGDAVARTTLTRHMQSWGMTPRAAASIEQALGWLRTGDPYDLAIVDDQLAVEGPAQVAAALWATGRGKLPIILVSARPVAVKEPFVAVLQKPVEASKLLAAVLEGAGQQPAPDGTQRHHEMRVLLVEDNVMNRRLALKVVETLGYEADVAENGEQALERLGERRYGVVLMDVHMPVMDGLEATRAICRNLARHDRPFIIGLTANALPGDRDMCLRAGMDEYLPKPMDQERLASLLRQAEGHIQSGQVMRPPAR